MIPTGVTGVSRLGSFYFLSIQMIRNKINRIILPNFRRKVRFWFTAHEKSGGEGNDFLYVLEYEESKNEVFAISY